MAEYTCIINRDYLTTNAIRNIQFTNPEGEISNVRVTEIVNGMVNITYTYTPLPIESVYIEDGPVTYK